MCKYKIIILIVIVYVINVCAIVISSELTTPEEEARKKKGISKKKASKLLPLLLIPFMIQVKIIPLILFQMKLVVTKALLIGKLAIFLILMNVIRNAILGTDYIDEQYEMQTLAHKHYGYNGGPEYGAWINRRKRRVWKRQVDRQPYR